MMKGQIAGLMKQAQAMQENLKRAQEEIGKLEVTGSAGGGMVKVTLTGRHETRRVEIEPSVISADDKDMLEDLIAAAFNDAANKVTEISAQKMADVQGGMSLPPGFKMPF